MKELNDDEIRVIGGEPGGESKKHGWKLALVIVALCAMVGVVALLLLSKDGKNDDTDSDATYFDSTAVQLPQQSKVVNDLSGKNDTIVGVTSKDTVINDVPLTIYQVHNLRASLHVGELKGPDSEPRIMMAMVAADIRADNGEIVSAFVLKGEPVSRGVAKRGYCAIIDGKITLGVDAETSLYERTIERKGDFFRQYPLVDKGRIVPNRIKNKAYRRALAQIGGEVVVVVSRGEESFHDFSQALVDLGAVTAVNLVGSKMRTGWVALPDSIVVPELSEPLPANVNYIVWEK